MGQTLSEPITGKESDRGGNSRFIYGSSSMQGWRITMEDAHSCLLSLDAHPDVSFFAVFDGHGGQSAAKYCGKNLHKKIAENGFQNGDYKLAIKHGYLDIDEDLRKDVEFLHDPSGCTAVSATISPDNKIYVGNAGDSRAVMSINGEAKALSFDHKPTNQGESARIINAGGFVEFGRVNGNLALSRAIGDFEFKQNSKLSAEEQAVTADPDITEHSITSEDEFIVIACDGIWDCMTSQEVIDYIRLEIAGKNSLEQICENIMNKCLAPNCELGGIGCDNMTIMIIGILNGKSEEEWFDWIAQRVASSSRYPNPDTADSLGNNAPPQEPFHEEASKRTEESSSGVEE
ncbi:PP2C-domain-containing protein [Basidiobolus meristosporus CBS 931.73]|uniref:protein-serine/threonine phosphatase n=1 Tax=Basidiobolus meristosporus CBS 931.73 TaxID=1314790 RepID=A0A1Y1YSP1_9FUNG|nr:PP2C-domain-containing protein [Basidiobolus meristosporus CBS 931.73]ORY00844.1 PP2C-domain-containing protein [Basidiobolus meristosporus CBS 931.73]|eukprot:ORX90082.1 PP2C-domain-containing protein [Basidiobolus meristosporus CBS 931.73]